MKAKTFVRAGTWRYTIHLQSLEIDQEEYDGFKRVGFRDWIIEQAELQNINYDYFEKKEEVK